MLAKTHKLYYCLYFIFAAFCYQANACLTSKPKQQCCEEIQQGYCFKKAGTLTQPDPECPNSFSPTFTLYTRTVRGGVPLDKANIPSAFSNDRRTVFLVHGWQGSFFHSDYFAVRDALLDKEDLNVIGTDWPRGADDYTYFQSASNTQTMGALIGATVNALRTVSGSNPFFWCVGRSLGAHVCGNTQLTARPLLDRITGCDPAGPSFHATEGLIRGSASKVDVIHTDSILGSDTPRGHVDFYPNGGDNQPSCSSSLFSRDGRDGGSKAHLTDAERIRIMQSALKERGSIGCSHLMSLTYFRESVKNTQCYVADQSCTSHNTLPGSCSQLSANEQKAVMGYDATSHRYDGIFYLEPNNTFPHCT